MDVRQKGIALTEYVIANYVRDKEIPDMVLQRTCWKCDELDDLIYSFKNALISTANLPRTYTADYQIGDVERFISHIYDSQESVSADGNLRIFRLIDRLTGEVIKVVYKRHHKTKSSYHGKPADEWVCSSAVRDDVRVRYAIDPDARSATVLTDSHGVVVVPGYVKPFSICFPDVKYDEDNHILTVSTYSAAFFQSENKIKKFAETKMFQLKGSLTPKEISNKDIAKDSWQKLITSKADFYKHHYNVTNHQYLILDPLYSSPNVLAINGPNMNGYEILVRYGGHWKSLDRIGSIQDNVNQEVQMARNVLSIS